MSEAQSSGGTHGVLQSVDHAHGQTMALLSTATSSNLGTTVERYLAARQVVALESIAEVLQQIEERLHSGLELEVEKVAEALSGIEQELVDLTKAVASHE